MKPPAPCRPAALTTLLLTLAALLFGNPGRLCAQAACVSAHEQAQHARIASRLLEARKQLLICAQAECPRLLRSDCAGWLSEVEESLPTVVFAVSDSTGGDLVDVRVYANGTLLTERTDGRAVAVDPGATKLRFEAPGQAPVEQTITVRASEKNRLLRVSLRAAQDASGASADVSDARGTRGTRSGDGRKARRLLLSSVLLGSLAVGAAASALGTGLRGKKLLDELERECAPYCSQSDDRPPQGRRLYIAADVTGAIALASAITSVWTYVAHRRALRTHVAASARRDGGFLTVTRSF